ncbi:MAG: hypothetical protein JWO45_1479 [Spartobacteria bacterium]|nr:hypothetical protein [Spartobacteria bacterium]
MSGSSIAVRFADHAIVVFDKSGTLRWILKHAIDDREETGTDAS